MNLYSKEPYNYVFTEVPTFEDFLNIVSGFIRNLCIVVSIEQQSGNVKLTQSKFNIPERSPYIHFKNVTYLEVKLFQIAVKISDLKTEVGYDWIVKLINRVEMKMDKETLDKMEECLHEQGEVAVSVRKPVVIDLREAGPGKSLSQVLSFGAIKLSDRKNMILSSGLVCVACHYHKFTVSNYLSHIVTIECEHCGHKSGRFIPIK